jgi:hypothetical protein
VIYTSGGGRILSVERARLLVEVGTDAGKEFLLTGRPVILGRGREADFPLEDRDISRFYARIQPCAESR